MKPSDKNKLKMYTRRATLVSGGMLLLSSALIGRMYYLQVTSRSQYELLAEQNRISMRLLAPTRGDIVDRYGRPIAASTTDYRVNVIPEETETLEDTLKALKAYVPISQRDNERILKASKKQRSFMPISVASNLDWETFSNVNVNMPDLPGIQPDVGTTRLYPEKELAAHIIGYVGAVSEEELTGDPLLEMPEFKIGKNGIEKVLDEKLRGSAGNSKVEVNVLGRVIRELSRQDSLSGETAKLTIDIEMQKFAANRVRDESAAVVVMDIHNGEILAIASTPSFDPNDFNGGISQKKWDALREDIRKPLINKAVSGQYSPGSTFKMVVALAALEDGIVTVEDTHFCNSRYQIGNRTAYCWSKGGHGKINIIQALGQSCDVYFYDLAVKVGIDKIHDMAAKFGIGERFNIGIMSEAKGINPNSDWKRGYSNEPWSGGDTVNVGIGQGFVSTTALQLAVMASRLANGGKMIWPKIFMDETGTETFAQDMGINPENLAIVLQGMSDVYNHERGTAFRYRLRNKEYTLAGKSGTTQVTRISTEERNSEGGVIKNNEKEWIGRDHAIFVGFGPVETPKYAVSVLLEHGGSGSTDASPIARDVLEYVLDKHSEQEEQTVDQGQPV
ncbi:MAG: penicillin-binding protein 2 [Kordiimonadaceae bacterium]|jgi:penicillin-binding protein 2|nr:penicillin-binding protein 2 [Kordiimonadaceae bacterium]MBT6035755.1 penicillin-binding protein 2 [Kordiimonadaceae bacterium]MBT6330766.1 penicillin-binding protein 2 [Kordiimonadaceae bacterium]